MKKKNLVIFTFLLGIFFVLNSCVTKPASQYTERWEKTYIGMSLEEFKHIWPEYKGPFKDMNNNIFYTVSSKDLNFLNVSVGKMSIVYFEFQENKLNSFTEQKL